MKTLLCLAALMLPLALTSCVGQQIPDAEFTARCVEWLKEHGKPPVDYLVSKFDEHTCVLVGEVHEVRQNCAFVAESLPRLFDEAGVLTFATEFLRARNTEAMNRIVTAPEYDEVAVIALMRDGPWPTWGFQGYADIFRAVWKINAEKLDDGPPLRVLGLDSDWEQHHLWFDDVTPTERIEILLARERTMVAAIADGPLAADSKVLVHCGYAHSVTCHGERLGTVLKRRFGDRVFQVSLHHELRTPAGRSWLTRWLEELVASTGRDALGFDVAGSPFADLRDDEVGQWGLVPDAGLGDLAMGYVYLAPHDDLGRARWIPGFIDDSTFAPARDIVERLGFVEPGECRTAAELDARLQQRYPR